MRKLTWISIWWELTLATVFEVTRIAFKLSRLSGDAVFHFVYWKISLTEFQILIRINCRFALLLKEANFLLIFLKMPVLFLQLFSRYFESLIGAFLWSDRWWDFIDFGEVGWELMVANKSYNNMIIDNDCSQGYELTFCWSIIWKSLITLSFCFSPFSLFIDFKYRNLF